MTAIAKRIEEEIRQLPLADLLMVHDRLAASIHEKEVTEQMDPAFRDEILRRVKEIDSGNALGEDAIEALKKL